MLKILDAIHHEIYGYGVVVYLDEHKIGYYFGDYPHNGKGFKLDYSRTEKQIVQLDALPSTGQAECLRAVHKRVIEANWQDRNLIEYCQGGAYWRWIPGCRGNMNYDSLPVN
jgi:hypothetical protein